MSKALTIAIMDAPFEDARTVTAFRLIDAALRAGHDVNVFAYEGAVALAFARQAGHANAVHGRDATAENHPLPRVWIAELLRLAKEVGRKLDKEIIAAVWLTPAELAARRAEHRSPLVQQCVDDYLAGRSFPLEVLSKAYG